MSIKTFTDDGVMFKTKTEDVNLAEFQSVVISEQYEAIREARKLEKKSRAQFYLIGDAKTPRHLMYCISEAQEIAQLL